MTEPKPEAKSNQTTIAGIVAAIGIMLAGLSALFDKDPSTNIDPATIIQALGVLLSAGGIAFGGVKARDDRVTSEGKVKPPPKAIGLILIPLLLATGCCSHVDHKKLATFPTIRKSFEGIKGNIQALKVKDERDEELKALTIEECDEGINLCRKAEAEK